MDLDNDVVFFAFTYPYSYATLQAQLNTMEETHVNTMEPGTIYMKRELIVTSIDHRRIDLITITDARGHSEEQEELIPGLFPSHGLDGAAEGSTNPLGASGRPLKFPDRDTIIVSARVHPGEVPAQHTMRGILDLLMDPHDPRSRALRERYVFKVIPMLNPDGVFRGHFRMDQLGQNLNRYYIDPDKLKQPAIFALRKLIDTFAENKTLAMYLDLHAHASKKGCFMYGNVVDTFEDQVQNQLFCRLIALNSPHFDYDGCLFSKDHMTRTDPGDGMTAEGSSRVSTYLTHRLIHSYTLECNYNTGKCGNEVVTPDGDLGASSLNPAYKSCEYTSNPEKYTPASWENVGQGCLIAMLDIRGQNPCSRIPKTKFRTLDRVRLMAVTDVRQLNEYRGCAVPDNLRRDNIAANMTKISMGKKSSRGGAGNENNATAAARSLSAEMMWKRFCRLPLEVSSKAALDDGGQLSSRRGSSNESGESAPSVAPALPRPPRLSAKSQTTSSKSAKISPRGNLLESTKRNNIANVNTTELSKSGPVTVTPEKGDRGARPGRAHPGKTSITVLELKKKLRKQIGSKGENSIEDIVANDNELAQMVSSTHRGDRSLSEALSPGAMHPPPRPLALMLRGKGGSGIIATKRHSHVPNTQLLIQRHSMQSYRSGLSARSNYSSDVENEEGSVRSGGLDAQSEIYEENINASSLLTGDDCSGDKPMHLVYPLRAGKKEFSSDINNSNDLAENMAKLAVNSNVEDRTSLSSSAITAEREKATIQIAKLMGKELPKSQIVSSTK